MLSQITPYYVPQGFSFHSCPKLVSPNTVLLTVSGATEEAT